MARVPNLVPYCERHGMKMVTVDDLIEYRRRTEKLVERDDRRAAADRLRRLHRRRVPRGADREDHVALVRGEVDGEDDVLVRVHSECLTGDVFHSLRCDCGEQLELALQRIAARSAACSLYMPRRAAASAC